MTSEDGKSKGQKKKNRKSEISYSDVFSWFLCSLEALCFSTFLQFNPSSYYLYHSELFFFSVISIYFSPLAT